MGTRRVCAWVQNLTRGYASGWVKARIMGMLRAGKCFTHTLPDPLPSHDGKLNRTSRYLSEKHKLGSFCSTQEDLRPTIYIIHFHISYNSKIHLNSTSTCKSSTSAVH
jgi:hypothetical protein